MNGSLSSISRGSSALPREVAVGIYIQTALFLLGGITVLVGVVKEQLHQLAAVLIFLLLIGIWSLWLYGLWSRRNWVRWLTIISNVAGLFPALHEVSAESSYQLAVLTYLEVAAALAVAVILLRPAASHWYRRMLPEDTDQAGSSA